MSVTRVSDGLTRIKPREPSDRKEVLALSIEQACESLKKLMGSGLNRKAIVTLVSDDARLGKREVEKVIDSLAGLHKTYCVTKVVCPPLLEGGK